MALVAGPLNSAAMTLDCMASDGLTQIHAALLKHHPTIWYSRHVAAAAVKKASDAGERLLTRGQIWPRIDGQFPQHDAT